MCRKRSHGKAHAAAGTDSERIGGRFANPVSGASCDRSKTAHDLSNSRRPKLAWLLSGHGGRRQTILTRITCLVYITDYVEKTGLFQCRRSHDPGERHFAG